MFNDLKEEIVLEECECPTCGEKLKKGDKLFFDGQRMLNPVNDSVCQYCLSDYKREVINEEGIDGRLLK